MVDNFFSSLVI
uniref:Uncharacterized protein n=1 Tax=Arundo donax TaxID=35708 RepID=A0A0A8Y597_ARUDO